VSKRYLQVKIKKRRDSQVKVSLVISFNLFIYILFLPTHGLMFPGTKMKMVT